MRNLIRVPGGGWVDGAVRTRLGATIDLTRAPGVVADGVTDDTVALNTALAALSAGQTAQIPAGRVIARSSDIATLPVNGTRLVGPGTLVATNPNKCSLRVTGDNCTVEGLVTAFAGTVRTPGAYTHGIVLENCRGALVRNVLINGAAATGIKASGASFYVIDRAIVLASLADGIHNTESSHDGLIINPIVIGNGDDSISIVSYTNDPAGPTYNINVKGARVGWSTPKGRGLTVVGGHDVTFDDFVVTNPNAAGIYCAAEGVGFSTFSATAVTYRNGKVVGASQNMNNGAVMITNTQPIGSGFVVDDILLENLTIQDTALQTSEAPPTTINRQLRWADNPGAISRICARNVATNGGPATIFTTTLAASQYRHTGWFDDTVAMTDVGTYVPIR